MHESSQVAPGPVYQGTLPIRNELYKRFVKGFPCIGCKQTWGIDPMHTGPHAYGRRGCDMRVLPGCRPCHRAFDANPKAFAKRHRLNIRALIRKFNALWKRRNT